MRIVALDTILRVARSRRSLDFSKREAKRRRVPCQRMVQGLTPGSLRSCGLRLLLETADGVFEVRVWRCEKAVMATLPTPY